MDKQQIHKNWSNNIDLDFQDNGTIQCIWYYYYCKPGFKYKYIQIKNVILKYLEKFWSVPDNDDVSVCSEYSNNS